MGQQNDGGDWCQLKMARMAYRGEGCEQGTFREGPELLARREVQPHEAPQLTEPFGWCDRESKSRDGGGVARVAHRVPASKVEG